MPSTRHPRTLLRGRSWRVFPAITTHGFYDSFAQYIELSKATSNELRKALGSAPCAEQVQVLPLLAHEVQHWVDHLSTLWGRRRLVLAFEAMEARAANDPSEFWRIIYYLRHIEADYFSSYYKTVDSISPSTGPRTPWQWRLTSGSRFNPSGMLADDRPIFFTQFAWPNDEVACRVPFSVSSLLETRAMSTELRVHIAEASTLEDGVREIELQQAVHRQLDRLYQPELAVYCAAVHLVGNLTGLTDAHHAFQLSSALAHLCLDLPSNMFSKLQIPDAFTPWKDRIPAALASRDRGFAYLVLAHHGSEAPSSDPVQWLETTAVRAGLPPLKEIATASVNESDSLRSNAVVGRFQQRLDHLWQIGSEIRGSLGYAATTPVNRLDIPLPPVLCTDLEWVLPECLQMFSNRAQVEAWWESCNHFTEQFEEFRAACGV